jgi:major type 1 subunit fimbrin (pilin)
MPQTASAAGSGTITISGQVVADSCGIQVGSGNNVYLPTVTTAAFAAAGSTAGDTNFNVQLTGCSTVLKTAQMAFSGTTIDSTNGNLNNQAGAGSNVQIQLLNGTNPINLSNNTNAPSISLSNGTGTYTLTARYFAKTTPVTAGTVSTTVNFTLTYQ